MRLAREHLGIEEDGEAPPELTDPRQMFGMFRRSAQRLDTWHAGGQQRPRLPGQLRVYRLRELSPTTRAWSNQLYRMLYDPDGRRPRDRLTRTF
jgi:hypothetical protein